MKLIQKTLNEISQNFIELAEIDTLKIEEASNLIIDSLVVKKLCFVAMVAQPQMLSISQQN